MSLSCSAHSELPILLQGADSPIPWPEEDKRDLEDKHTSSFGSLLTQISHQHHSLGFVQTLKTEAVPILNMSRETLESKCAM